MGLNILPLLTAPRESVPAKRAFPGVWDLNGEWWARRDLSASPPREAKGKPSDALAVLPAFPFLSPSPSQEVVLHQCAAPVDPL